MPDMANHTPMTNTPHAKEHRLKSVMIAWPEDNKMRTLIITDKITLAGPSIAGEISANTPHAKEHKLKSVMIA